MTTTLAHPDRSPGELAATEPSSVAASVEPVTLESLAAQVADVRAELARLVAIAETLAASAGQVTATLSKGGLGSIMGLLMGGK